MVKLRFREPVKGHFPNGKRNYQAGQTYDIDDQEARLWIKRGYAEPAPAAAADTGPATTIERATRGASECAALKPSGDDRPRPKPRARRRRKAASGG